MKKYLYGAIALGSLTLASLTSAYCTQDGDVCGYSDSRTCMYYCTGSRYEEPYCPAHCPDYHRYNNNSTYYWNGSYYYANDSYNNDYYGPYYDSRYSQDRYNNSDWTCALYDDTDRSYYQDPYYYSTSRYCDCAGRSNCSCGYYENPNANNWTPTRRCVQWKKY